jgi:hypothetical protein
LQYPPKFTQIWNFGLKTNHLATLENSPKNYYCLVADDKTNL